MTAAQFKKARKALGYSQTGVAKALGLSIRQISRFETGDRAVDEIVRLAMIGLKTEASK